MNNRLSFQHASSGQFGVLNLHRDISSKTRKKKRNGRKFCFNSVINDNLKPD